MAELQETAPKLTAKRVIYGVLWLQVGIGVFLVGGDLSRSLPDLFTRTNAPGFTSPVAPGDQTRRYDPDSAPEFPDTPTRPYPAPDTMPKRLAFEVQEVAGAPALTLTGQIAPGDAARFADWLESNDLPPRVYLNSPGGSVRDALDLGETLRARDITTIVGAGDICFSACPYLFASGTTRIADRDGAVGVHQHYYGENMVLPAFVAVEEIQRGQAQVVDYLDTMGIDLRLMKHSLATPPEEIYVLLPEELIEYRLASEISG
ncbi:hypothetical protein AQS8620_02608 [Aquimixticola soesokkakensis]|uniref:Clp protease n=1 Tax=Aquimixticola soesokkakensis TaxID=1519096 RepID=A0A1Y5TCP7_9RHOB|nr:hypothetical protein [Aquimixticola soesokkakensis]SLN58914.1 hypothetical protein AQS8620_02608 [Aquimixticola soesokkakensis]